MGLMETMLKMIDKEHSIVLTEDIGLIGNNDYKVGRVFDELRYLGDFYPDIKLGEHFMVVTSDAVILIEELIDLSGIIYEDSGEKSYIFKLKDYTVEDNTWAILDESLSDTKPALIYYKNDKIQTNCKELKDKYEYNSELDCYMSKDRVTRLLINGTSYAPKTLSFENSIYSFSVYRKV